MSKSVNSVGVTGWSAECGSAADPDPGDCKAGVPGHLCIGGRQATLPRPSRLSGRHHEPKLPRPCPPPR